MLPCPFVQRAYCARPALLSLLACLLWSALTSAACPGASAAGVVKQPTEAALNAAMQGGGVVTFACDGVIPITREC